MEETPDIIIDEEFKSLIPPLTDDEYSCLSESIRAEGCRDALVLWGNILVDGHNRCEICLRYGIPFQTVQREFADRQQAIEWIILNQFARRNLPIHERARLALRLKPIIAQRAKEKQTAGINQYSNEKSLMQNSAQGSFVTREEIAKLAGVSHDTVAKVERIEANAPEAVVKAARQGEISVNTAYHITKLEPEQQEEIAEKLSNNKAEPAEIKTPKEIINEVISRPFVTNNSGNSEWYTPEYIIEAARTVMGSIDLDPASNEFANRVVGAAAYYTTDDNGLEKEWTGNIWLNPPFTAGLIGKFIDKLVEERKNYSQAIILVNNCTETEWFNKAITLSTAVCFPLSRIRFYNTEGFKNAPLQGQAIIYIGDNAELFTEVFRIIGWCAYIVYSSEQKNVSIDTLTERGMADEDTEIYS